MQCCACRALQVSRHVKRAGPFTRSCGAGRAAHDAPKHGVLEVQVPRALEQDEELAAVAVRAAVGHGQHAAPGVGQPLVQLVAEGRAVDRLAARASAGRVAALRARRRRALSADVTQDRYIYQSGAPATIWGLYGAP